MERTCGGAERRGVSVVCPKPRRIGLLNPSVTHRIRPSIWQTSCQTEISDSKAGTELLDIILTEGSCSMDKSNAHAASSPPFFCGSPPNRASNPLIQDSQFGNSRFSPLSEAPISAASPSSSAHKGGSCARMKLGHKPAAVRIEGFNCLSRDRRSISAVA
ncbi:uncharacterized protein LOC127793056 [Diospyros lotus]|uniref:uncharacterized protein LOC127793056 n=1 Tax=Diospyros lotus TaxID=55363 RepID=UPI00224F00CE|nr:uncharacterized protein LOC127793056 [Diospyros lotus]